MSNGRFPASFLSLFALDVFDEHMGVWSTRGSRSPESNLQRLKAALRIGREGISPHFLAALDHEVNHRELVKAKFEEFKEK